MSNMNQAENSGKILEMALKYFISVFLDDDKFRPSVGLPQIYSLRTKDVSNNVIYVFSTAALMSLNGLSCLPIV